MHNHKLWTSPNKIIIIIIDNRGLNARWCLTPLLLSLPTAAYLTPLKDNNCDKTNLKKSSNKRSSTFVTMHASHRTTVLNVSTSSVIRDALNTFTTVLHSQQPTLQLNSQWVNTIIKLTLQPEDSSKIQDTTPNLSAIVTGPIQIFKCSLALNTRDELTKHWPIINWLSASDNWLIIGWLPPPRRLFLPVFVCLSVCVLAR